MPIDSGGVSGPGSRAVTISDTMSLTRAASMPSAKRQADGVRINTSRSVEPSGAPDFLCVLRVGGFFPARMARCDERTDHLDLRLGA